MASLKNNYVFELGGTLLVGGTTVNISNDLELGQTVTFTNASVVFRNRDASIIERAVGTAAAGVLTLSKRGLVQDQTETEDPALQKERREGTRCYVTVLASQILDAKRDNAFLGTQTFNNIDVNGDTTLEDTTISGKYRGPVVADVTARDALYPTPVTGDEVYVESLNAKQVYNGTTVQWESLEVGTPPQQATESIVGIARLATQAEVDSGSNDNAIVTPLKLRSQVPEALYDRDTYILGEDVLENDSLFAETSPTFAESTLVQNIGDVTANTRVALYGFGSGVSGNTMQYALRSFVSPSADLSVRVETVDGSGNATGTLVDANAQTTITLTNTLTNVTITFPGNFTIPKGQKFAIVLSQVGDVVNGTNYYGVGYVNRHTIISPIASYDGTNWFNPGQYDEAHGITFTSSISNTADFGVKIECLTDVVINQITKSPTATATSVLIKNSGGTTLHTATFTGDIASVPSLYYPIGTILRIETTGGSRTQHRATGSVVTKTNIKYLGGSANGSDNASIADIVSIQSVSTGFHKFPYINTTLALPTVLSKTDATYSYKLPTDFPRFATESKSAGEEVICARLGLKDGFSGLTPVTYYASNIPGLISATPGIFRYSLGDGFAGDTLDIYPKMVFGKDTYGSVSTTVAGTEINRFVAPSTGISSVRVTISSGSTGNTFRVVINSVIVYETPAATGTATQHTGYIRLSKGDVVQLLARNSSGTNSMNISNLSILLT